MPATRACLFNLFFFKEISMNINFYRFFNPDIGLSTAYVWDNTLRFEQKFGEVSFNDFLGFCKYIIDQESPKSQEKSEKEYDLYYRSGMSGCKDYILYSIEEEKKHS